MRHRPRQNHLGQRIKQAQLDTATVLLSWEHWRPAGERIGSSSGNQAGGTPALPEPVFQFNSTTETGGYSNTRLNNKYRLAPPSLTGNRTKQKMLDVEAPA